MTAGSLSALQASVAEHHRRRAQTRRSFAYLGLFVASLLIAAVATLSGWTGAPLLVLVFSAVGLFSALKTLDCVVGRSWECLRLHYQ